MGDLMVHKIKKSMNPADWVARDVERVKKMTEPEEAEYEEEYGYKKQFRFPMGE
jgi:hypothetical protein